MTHSNDWSGPLVHSDKSSMGLITPFLPGFQGFLCAVIGDSIITSNHVQSVVLNYGGVVEYSNLAD